MATLGELRSTLLEAPEALLDVDDRKVLVDAVTSLDALDRLDVVPTVVAFVGSSGAGKSTIVNAMVGSRVSEVGVVRPTTVRTSMIGRSGPVSLSVESDYIHVPDAPPGVLVIDTPPWEHDAPAISSVLDVADAVVVVLTPSRYADATVADLVSHLSDETPTTVVLNRVIQSGRDRDVLVESVASVHGSDVVVIDEGASIDGFAADVLARLPVDSTGYERAAVLRSAAASGARHIAGALTAAATEIGVLAGIVDGITVADFSSTVHTVFDEWPPTRADLTRTVARRVHDIDSEIIERSDVGLSRRLHGEIGRWEGEETVAAMLDAWWSETQAQMASLARTWWRPKSLRDQIDRYGWRVAVNASSSVPPRMRRVLGDRLQSSAATARARLDEVMAAAVHGRVVEWREHLEGLASYAPGVLLGIADAFDPARIRHG